MVESKTDTAYLSNIKDCISFSFNDKTIRFKGPYSLVSFKDIKLWDHGYLVVDVYYTHHDEPVEDYIDMVPMLEDLYIDSEDFLKPIKNVEVRYV